MSGIFQAYDIRGIYEAQGFDLNFKTITPACAYILGQSHARTLGHKHVVIGRDCRIGSLELAQAYMDGLRDFGVTVTDIGFVTTPMLWFAVNHLKLDGGAMITASHNPKEYNGVKICTKQGIPVGTHNGLSALEDFARKHAQLPSGPARRQAPVHIHDITKSYINYLTKYGSQARHLRIVIDTSNGCVGSIIGDVLNTMELTTICINTIPDGTFPNHVPNPLEAHACDGAIRKVRDNEADFGVVFDGDGDRAIFIDETGKVIAPDMITALIGSACIDKTITIPIIHPHKTKATLVTDLRASKSVAEVISQAGGTVVRCAVGRPSIVQAMQENNARFGGELSGHYYFSDFWNLDSGLRTFLAICQALSLSNMPISELIKNFSRYSKSTEQSVNVVDANAVLLRLAEAYKSTVNIETLDGITLSTPTWWCNVRASNTEPLLRIVAEANTDEILTKELNQVLSIIKQVNAP